MTRMKKIKGFSNYYVTDLGDVYSRNFNRQRKPNKLCPNKNNTDDYFRVILRKDGVNHSKLVHRLVAEAFIPNSDNKPQINHKNGVKQDNRVENLEWCTNSENVIHRYRVLGHKQSKGKNNPKTQIVLQIQNNKIVAEFYGLSEAQTQTGINRGNICLCCNGKHKTAGGYFWKYKGVKR